MIKSTRQHYSFDMSIFKDGLSSLNVLSEKAIPFFTAYVLNVK